MEQVRDPNLNLDINGPKIQQTLKRNKQPRQNGASTRTILREELRSELQSFYEKILTLIESSSTHPASNPFSPPSPHSLPPPELGKKANPAIGPPSRPPPLSSPSPQARKRQILLLVLLFQHHHHILLRLHPKWGKRHYPLHLLLFHHHRLLIPLTLLPILLLQWLILLQIWYISFD